MSAAFAILWLAQAELDPRVFPPEGKPADRVVQETRDLIRAANRRESEAWAAVRTVVDWERYRDARLRALRASLGTFPEPPNDLRVRVTRTLEGEGYAIENLAFESRPGLVVTANLYVPPKPAKAGILICHSHHNPRTQGELQDMGVSWAKEGALVLVMDQLGHGERRQHPFRDASSYAKAFRVGRQDYFFRYNVGIQLHLIGDGLIGWMAWDLMRGADLLFSRGAERVALLGAVAGGGDPAAVTAAVDPRIWAAVPFNFGGPQPESRYPLPEDAETSFNYAGGGSWESTRNLRLSARDGFLPWVIVGAIAPRRLVYAHEFSWDRGRDPVWKRLERIYAFYGAGDGLASTTGRGVLTGKPPEATHCNNIGAEHRKGIHEAFQKWLGLPGKEAQDRRPAEDLLCGVKVPPLHEVADALGRERAAAAPRGAEALRAAWSRVLGPVEPGEAKVVTHGQGRFGERQVERLSFDHVPFLLIRPAGAGRRPAVVAFAQEGKETLLKKRAEAIQILLEGGAAVALVDLRGTGETDFSRGSRGRSSGATSVSSGELMLGRTMVGLRLRELRTVLRYLRGREDVEGIALWGDSFAPALPKDRPVEVPLDADLPSHAEPMGGVVAVLCALFEDIQGVYAAGGLTSFGSVLRSPFVYIPHDLVVPGALTTGDIPAVVEALKIPLRQDGWVDGLNRRDSEPDPKEGARWLLGVLKR